MEYWLSNIGFQIVKPANIIMRSIQGEKRRFIFFGCLNVLITNICLQIIILIFPIGIATLASQAINTFLGFHLYGKKVFKMQKIKKFTLIKYVLLSIMLWNLNWISIDILYKVVSSKNVAALIVLPVLALISYFSQRNFIFSRENNDI